MQIHTPQTKKYFIKYLFWNKSYHLRWIEIILIASVVTWINFLKIKNSSLFKSQQLKLYATAFSFLTTSSIKPDFFWFSSSFHLFSLSIKKFSLSHWIFSSSCWQDMWAATWRIWLIKSSFRQNIRIPMMRLFYICVNQ